MEYLFTSVLFLTIYFSIVLYLLIGVLNAKAEKNNTLGSKLVTVVVVSRNEGKYISSCLQALSEQETKYPYEVLLVNDNSSDDTVMLAESFRSKIEDLRIVTTAQSVDWKSRKKAAIAQVINQAKGSILLLMDADCIPGSSWISNMVYRFDRQTGIVAGFSPQFSNCGALWNDFLFLDSLAASLVAAGTMGHGIGVTCTGRNLCYRKNLIRDVGGYNTFPDSLSGDDDFLVQLAAKETDWQMRYSFDPKTVVPAAGPDSWRTFLRQKRRHLSAGKYYSRHVQLFYFIFHASNLGLWVLAYMSPFIRLWLMLPLAIKIILDFAVLLYYGRIYGRGFSWYALLCWELLFPAYHLCTAPTAWRENIRWK